MARARGGAPAVDPAEEAKRAERKARHERSQRVAARRRAAEAETAGPVPGALGRRDSTTRSRPRRSGARGSSRVCPWPSTPGWWTSGRCSSGQWGLRGSRAGQGPRYEELVETEGRPRLRYWLDRLATEGVLSSAAVVYGYFPAVAEGDTLVVLDGPRADAGELPRFTFPRQRRDRHLCLADFWRPRALAVAPGGGRAARCTWSRWASRSPTTRTSCSPRTPTATTSRCTGSGVQLTEALAEYWHRRIREELTFPTARPSRPEDPAQVEDVLQARLSRRPLLAGLRRVPEPRRPHQDRRPAATRPDRRRRCPRSCSCTPSSPPTRSWHTTRRPSTSMPADPPPCPESHFPGATSGKPLSGRAAPCPRPSCGTGRHADRLRTPSGTSRCRPPSGGSAASSATAAALASSGRLDRAVLVLLGRRRRGRHPGADRRDPRSPRLAHRGAVRRRRRRVAARGARRAATLVACGRATDGAGDQQPARTHRARPRRHRPRAGSTSPSAATRCRPASRLPIRTCAPRNCSSVPIEACVAVEDSPNGALSAERAGAAVLVVPGEVPVPRRAAAHAPRRPRGADRGGARRSGESSGDR